LEINFKKVDKLFKKKPTKAISSQVVVRQNISWQYRLIILAGSSFALMLLAWTVYELGRQTNNPQGIITKLDIEKLYQEGSCLPSDRKELCTQLATINRQLQIINITSENLTEQVKQLGAENDRMKEELDFFQHLMSGKEKIDKEISVYRFKLIASSKPGVYRYGISFAQGGQRPTDFNGSLRLTVNLKQDNIPKSIPLTHKGSGQDLPLNFKFFHKLEENFRIPSNAILQSLQIEVFKENSATAILTQTIKPSS